MLRRSIIFFCIGIIALGMCWSIERLFSTSPTSSCAQAEIMLVVYSNAMRADGGTLVQVLRDELAALSLPVMRVTYCREVGRNLLEKGYSQNLSLTTESIRHHVLEYERFKVESFISSGVAPKRYFGFFDRLGNTSQEEKILIATIADAVDLANRFAVSEHMPVDLSAKDVAVTFLAEGGALVLTSQTDSINRIHPVLGVGLDDYKKGLRRYPGLVHDFDQHFGTKLGQLILTVVGDEILTQPMTFQEAILGTTLMFLYEKNLAAHQYLETTGQELRAQPGDKQFVIASLMYNSGRLFSDERVQQLLHFNTAQYLSEVNSANRGKRPMLPVATIQEALKQFERGDMIPPQRTSWNAVYHVLQRYGAWVALEKFSDVFDADGSFKPGLQ